MCWPGFWALFPHCYSVPCTWCPKRLLGSCRKIAKRRPKRLCNFSEDRKDYCTLFNCNCLFLISFSWPHRHTDVTGEFERLKANMAKGANSQQIQPKDLLKGSVLKPLLLSMALMLLQQFSGINSIIYFTVFIFQKAGSTMDKNLSTIVSGLPCIQSWLNNNIKHFVLICATDRRHCPAFGHYCFHVFGW